MKISQRALYTAVLASENHKRINTGMGILPSFEELAKSNPKYWVDGESSEKLDVLQVALPIAIEDMWITPDSYLEEDDEELYLIVMDNGDKVIKTLSRENYWDEETNSEEWRCYITDDYHADWHKAIKLTDIGATL